MPILHSRLSTTATTTITNQPLPSQGTPSGTSGSRGFGTNSGYGGGGTGGGSYRGTSWSGSSFAVGAFAGYLGGIWVGHGPFHGGASGRDPKAGEPPADCVVARALNEVLRPKVDCSYTWEHGLEKNFLLYAIRVTASGQEVKGWRDGVVDNIQGEVSCPTHLLLRTRVLVAPVNIHTTGGIFFSSLVWIVMS